jgi:beta-phosphoglucomutase-like phosphatase (HAD superfamily)
MKYRCVIFDRDGTLVGTRGIAAARRQSAYRLLGEVPLF